MVTRGRVNRGWTVGLSWAAKGGKLTPPCSVDAEALGTPISTAELVCVRHWEVDACSQALLPIKGVCDADAGEADVDK